MYKIQALKTKIVKLTGVHRKHKVTVRGTLDLLGIINYQKFNTLR